MEDFVLIILCIAVVWLAVKLSMLSQDVPNLIELRDLITRLEQRIAFLERTPRPGPEAVAQPVPTPPQPEVTPTRIEPVPRPAAAIKSRYPSLRSYEARPEAASALASTPIPREPEPFTPPQLRRVVSSPPVEEPAPQRSISLEERFGQNWLSKIGIILVVIGIACFLGYKLSQFGPLGKSLTGIIISLVILGVSVFLELNEKYRVFARAGIGGGWALTFFVTFALYHVDAMRVLPSEGIDLILMLTVAAGMVAHSLKYRSQAVTSLAFLLAFVTVGISHVTLFSLVAGALLAAGVAIVAGRYRWFELAAAGLAGAYCNHFLWLTRVLPEGGQPGHPFPQFFSSAGLLILYWLLFRLLFVLRVPETPQQQTVSSLTAILNSAGLLVLLKYQSAHPEWAFYALLALGAAEWVFAFIGRTRWRISFLVLSTIASGMCLAAIPFRFSGAHWTLLWLLEAEILFLAGVRMPESIFRRIGMIAGFFASLQIVVVDLLPISQLRAAQPDPSRHPAVAIALFCAAALFWFNADVISRRSKSLFAGELDNAALLVTSYLAAAMLSFALWVVFPGAWTAIAWLVAALAIAYAARTVDAVDLATQADLITLVALIRIGAINFSLAPAQPLAAISLRAVTVTLAAALLYAGMARRVRSRVLPSEFIPAAWSWAASALLAVLAWYELAPLHLAIAWGVFGLILFELGAFFRRACLRHQAYALFAASFIRIFFVDLDADSVGHNASHRLYTVLPLIAAYLWVYERTRRTLADSDLDLFMGMFAAWAGTAATAALLYFQVRPEHVVIAWAALAMWLLYIAWILKRPIFTAQSLTLLAAATVDALLFHLIPEKKIAETLWTSRSFSIAAACLLMLLSLPAAFAIRRQRLASPEAVSANPILTHPEQPFFFVPFALLVVLIAVEFSAGRITIGWIALGLAAFLSALPVGERSYRLAGLSLLMLGLAKIIAVDIWSATPTDRYLTLIVTGLALSLVSFLYSKYRQTILKLL